MSEPLLKSAQAADVQGTRAPQPRAAPARGLRFEARRLSRAGGGTRLVDEVSVAIEPGEILAVVGASGAGKSSFLRLLNRLDEPTGGTVLLDGADYRAMAEIARGPMWAARAKITGIYRP